MKCTRCSRETVNGFKLCQFCRDKNKELYRIERREHPERIVARKKKSRLTRKDKISEYRKRYYAENREVIREKANSSYVKHPLVIDTPDVRKEKMKLHKAKYVAANKEKIALKTKQYQETHKERIRGKQQQYRLSNAEKTVLRKQVYNAANREKIARYSKKYREENPKLFKDYWAERRARERAAFVAPVDHIEIFERDGYICQLCGTGVLPFVNHRHRLYPSIDHIIPLAKGGTHEPSNVQTAHRGCNSSKGPRLRMNDHYTPEVTP